MSRQTKYVVVLEVVGEYNKDWPPEPIQEFIAWFEEKVGGVPEEWRDAVMVEIDSEGGYDGDHDPSIELYYHRPETDGEMAAREQADKAAEFRNERHERATLARLLEKYRK